jgi:hypothetical protein
VSEERIKAGSSIRSLEPISPRFSRAIRVLGRAERSPTKLTQMKNQKSKPVKIEKREFKSEHKRLATILRSGSKPQRVREAVKQTQELKEKE